MKLLASLLRLQYRVSILFFFGHDESVPFGFRLIFRWKASGKVIDSPFGFHGASRLVLT